MTRAELAKELRNLRDYLEYVAPHDKDHDALLVGKGQAAALQNGFLAAAAALEEEDRDGLVPTDAVRVSIEHITELERDARRYRVLGDLISLHGSIYQIEFTIHDDVTCIYRKFKDRTSEIKGPWHPTLDAALDAWIEEHDAKEPDTRNSDDGAGG